MKQKFYDITNLLKQKAQYNLLLGERSNGKSYQCKYMPLWEAYHGCDYLTFRETGKMIPKKRSQLGYLRRWREEIKKNDIIAYFADAPIEAITNGEYSGITVYQQDIFLTRIDEKTGLEVRGKKIGRAFCLTGETHYKSLAFPEIGNVIFEEFITKSGYLPKEVDTLTSLISTIARRDEIRVLMVGNTLSRLCPYFDEWQLVNVKKQKQGTIDIYRCMTTQYNEDGSPIVVNIAVEYCENSGSNSKMFFGNNSKMITSGVWESEVFPHLQGRLNDYECYYQILYKYSSFAFVITLLVDDGRKPFLYIMPDTKTERKRPKRIVSQDFTTDKYTTLYLTNLTKYDTLVLELLEQKKVVFSDNLTGTEFYQIKKERGRF